MQVWKCNNKSHYSTQFILTNKDYKLNVKARRLDWYLTEFLNANSWKVGRRKGPKDQGQERGGIDLNQDKSLRTRLEKMSSWWPGKEISVLRPKFQASRFPGPLTLQKWLIFLLRVNSPSLLEDPGLNNHCRQMVSVPLVLQLFSSK